MSLATTAPGPSPETLIEPVAGEWPRRISRHLARRTEPQLVRSAKFRRELGLPANRPILGAGHQAGFWHPGILAKRFALAEACRTLGAAPMWLVVDQDTNDPALIRFPTRSADGRLGVSTVSLVTGQAPGADEHPIPACSRPAAAPAVIDHSEAATPAIREGIERLREAMSAFASESSLARQAARAAESLAAPGTGAASLVFASSLCETSLFRELLARMAGDPGACTRAYNLAVEMLPEARIAPLRHDEARTELPLWRVRPGAPRVRVFADELEAIPPEELAPRALLATGLLRLAGCELFIHGTGGGVYDRITEAWLETWLGESIAPLAVVSATLRLDLGFAGPSPKEATQAQWRSHHARHDLTLLGDAEGAARKAEFVTRIGSGSRAERSRLFQDMQTLLRESRARHARELGALDQAASQAAELLRDAEVAWDRTWPFPLYAPAQLEDLRARFDREFPTSNDR